MSINCTVSIQKNGLYKIEIEEPYFCCLKTKKVIRDLTDEQVKRYEVPWCKISTGNGVPLDVFPRRIFTT